VPDFLIRIAIRLLLRQRLREIDAGSFADNHEAKMKWIEGVRNRDAIADLTHKANEQHYEVRTQPHNHNLARRGYLSLQTKLTTFPGQNRVHSVDTGTVCKVLLVSLSHRKGNAGSSGEAYAGELLCEGAAEGWAGNTGPRMW
jgi:hypothetical protein